MPFQPDASPLISGTITVQLNDPGGNPVNVVKATELWTVAVQWTMTGSLACAQNVGGSWRVQAIFESLGTPNDVLLPSPPANILTTAVPCVGNTRTYNHTIAAGPNVPAGNYVLVVVINAEDAGGNPVNLAANEIVGVVQVYP